MSLQHELVRAQSHLAARFNPGCWDADAGGLVVPEQRRLNTAPATGRTIVHSLDAILEDDPESYTWRKSWQRFSQPGSAALSTCALSAQLAPMMDIIHTLEQRAVGFPRGRPPRYRHVESLKIRRLLTGLLIRWRRQGFLRQVCAGGELPGAGPDQSTLFEHRAADARWPAR